MSGVIEDSWIPIPASAVGFWLGIWRKPCFNQTGWQREVCLKGLPGSLRNSWTTFSGAPQNHCLENQILTGISRNKLLCFIAEMHSTRRQGGGSSHRTEFGASFIYLWTPFHACAILAPGSQHPRISQSQGTLESSPSSAFCLWLLFCSCTAREQMLTTSWDYVLLEAQNWGSPGHYLILVKQLAKYPTVLYWHNPALLLPNPVCSCSSLH